MNNKSPLRYPGGKTRACDHLYKIAREQFPDIFDVSVQNPCKRIISPFFGGGSFEFFLQNQTGIPLWINDGFGPLAQFWKVCKESSTELCVELYKYIGQITKDVFMEFRRTIMTIENDAMRQSVMYFIINRCSFSGATLSGGFSTDASTKRFTTSSIERIRKMDLSQVYMPMNGNGCHFTVFLQTIQWDDSTDFVFLDPPYYLPVKKTNLYGKGGNMHEHFNHDDLFACICTKRRWILTYNDCPYIRELYKDFMIIDTQWSYGMNVSKTSSEIVIISP